MNKKLLLKLDSKYQIFPSHIKKFTFISFLLSIPISTNLSNLALLCSSYAFLLTGLSLHNHIYIYIYHVKDGNQILTRSDMYKCPINNGKKYSLKCIFREVKLVVYLSASFDLYWWSIYTCPISSYLIGIFSMERWVNRTVGYLDWLNLSPGV